MITYVKGDIFSSPARILVNTVNTVGVMGKGVALEFKKRYPDMFYEYKKLCEEKKLDIGSLFLWKKSEKWVLLFPTKKHWRNPSRLEYIEAGLKKFAQNWDKMGAESVAFPRLGCGNGALDWEDVKPLMERYLSRLPIQIYIYVGHYEDPCPEHLDITEMERWLSGEGEMEGFEKFLFRFKKVLLEKKVLSLPGSHECSVDEGSGFISIDGQDVDEKEICDFWNYIRDAGIVEMQEIPVEYEKIAGGFFELLKELGYVAGVIVSKGGEDFPSEVNAYQYVAD